ncbi:MAG: kinase [Planctomycetota bacterium]|jgi:serine/threonine protein kinase|nr:kinase [Planctomycetota bacterium]
MTVVKAIAADGTQVEFVKENPRQGGVKDVYFDPNRRYVVAFFRKKLDLVGRDRIEKLVGQYRKGIFERDGGDYWRERFRWPERIVEYEGHTGIVVPIYQPQFFFGANTILDGVEKDGKWFASAKNFNRFVPNEEKGSLLGYLRLCLNLSRAVRRLHAAGLAHSDLSYKNCLVDPSTGGACIIDIDGLVVPGLFPPDVVGTPDFIAPEVIATLNLCMDDHRRRHPCRETDQHALSVLIYQYLLHRHPLRGGKIHHPDAEEQDRLEMGEKALFIENPQDRSNRYRLQKSDRDFLPWVDCDKLPYTIMGPYLKEYFDKAFITGLHNPDQRPSADNWEDALVRTCDLVQPCLNPSCVKKWYVFDNTTRPACPYCGTPFRGQLPILDFYSSRDGVSFLSDRHRLMVYNNQYLYRWHVDRSVFPNERLSEADRKPVGYFVFHKNRWIFINQALPGLTDAKAQRKIGINEFVELGNGTRLLLSPGKTGRLAHVSLVEA